MEVNIYINIYFEGRQKSGTGIYCIVLEYIAPSGNPHTKEIFEGVNSTTRHRTALKACITALDRMNKPCLINLYINDTYVTETMIQGWFYKWNFDTWTNKEKPVANADLWKQLFKQLEKQKVKFEYAASNPYTSYFETKLRHMTIPYQEDRKGSP